MTVDEVIKRPQESCDHPVRPKHSARRENGHFLSRCLLDLETNRACDADIP